MSPLPRKGVQQVPRRSIAIRAMALTLVALGLSACASAGPDREMGQDLAMGNRICRGEATQIYFSNQDDGLSPSAVRVLSELSASLNRCQHRTIFLLAVSGDDGAPASATLAEQRLYRVRSTLLQGGLSEGRFGQDRSLAPPVRLPHGPIGGVIVLTRR